MEGNRALKPYRSAPILFSFFSLYPEKHSPIGLGLYVLPYGQPVLFGGTPARVGWFCLRRLSGKYRTGKLFYRFIKARGNSCGFIKFRALIGSDKKAQRVNIAGT
jgi:hypothetical protein